MAIKQRPHRRPTLMATISLIIFVKKLQACAKSKPESRGLNKDEIKNELEKRVLIGHQKPVMKNVTDDPMKLIQQIDDHDHMRTSNGRLSDVAANDSLFLGATPVLPRHMCSKQLTSDIQATKCYLSKLQGTQGSTEVAQHDGLKQGKPFGIVIDAKFLANLEHLLLRHLEVLLSRLAANIWIQVAMVVSMAQQVFGDEYFTEYQDGRRRQTTTWPWCIKSSLAILWGVCWKFVVKPGHRGIADQLFAPTGFDEFSQSQVPDSCSLACANEPFYYGLTEGQDVTGFVHDTNLFSQAPFLDSCIPVDAQPRGPNAPGESFNALPLGLGTEAPEASGNYSNVAGGQVYSVPQYPTGTYSRASPNTLIFDHSPHHVSSPGFPGGQLEFRNPQISEESQARHIQESSGIYMQPCQPQLTLQLPNSDASNTYNLSPYSSEMAMSSTKIGSDRTRSSTPSGASSTSFSYPTHHPDDETDPLPDADGNIHCTECKGEIVSSFKRPCEWRKHMDKHRRPYKCLEPQCSKLSGFTYAGGLSRHEREVHGKGAGVEKLYCPYATCKRSKRDNVMRTKHFTRKENLSEHIRRLHTDSVPGASSPDPTGKKRRRRNTPSDGSDVNSDASDEEFGSETKRLRKECEDLRHLTKLLTGKMDQMEELFQRRIKT